MKLHKFNCLNCDEYNEKKISPANLRLGKGKYCNRSCMVEYRVKNKLFVAEKNAQWKGGRIIHKRTGYVHVLNRRENDSRKYIQEHVLVMEEEMGRRIEKDEIVHHINHIRTDNRIENLQLMKRSDHSRMHASENNFGGHNAKH